MKPIKLIKDCTFGKNYYYKDDVIEPNKDNLEMIKILNRKGFIIPLTLKEIEEIEKNINKPKFKKEEE